jgi:uncharacterized protein (DUF433 family)
MTSSKDTSITDPFRVGKAYTVKQAASHAGVSHQTVRDWLFGNESRGYLRKAVFGEREKPDDAPVEVSFLELSELVVVSKWRKLKLKLERIRDAHEFARSEWGVPYPFATLNLQTLGGHVLGRYQESVPGQKLVVLTSPGQYVLPDIVEEELHHFDYSETDKFAIRWWPYGKDIPVVVDPRFAGGQPTVVDRGVTIEILKRRWNAKESLHSIAREYRLKPPVVEAILQRITT